MNSKFSAVRATSLPGRVTKTFSVVASSGSTVTLKVREVVSGMPFIFITAFGIRLGYLLGGAIVVETIFGLPGLGKLVVTAVNQRNYTVVQGAVLVIATLFIVVNLVTDLLYGWLDPRIGEEAER